MKRPSPLEAPRADASVRTLSGALLLGMLALGVLSTSGCVAPAAPAPGTRPTLLNPRWNDEAFARHLDFFADAFRENRLPASAPVSRYVSGALRRAWLQPVVEGRYELQPVRGRPSGYAGYVGGKNPPVAQEAVLVCADLGPGGPATGAAALLEVARVYGVASQFTVMPERSVIFALWPRPDEQEDALDGLRAYLRQPTWALDRVRAVLYVGLPAARRAEAQALLREHDIPLQRVTLPPTGDAGAGASDTGISGATAATTAASRVQQLAERTHRRLRAATLTGGDIMPALGDTLRVPRAGPE